MTYIIRENYEPTLYVERKQELQLAQDWWWKSKKRLLSVTAPPATGKTWFLRKLEETFKAAGIISFWVDVGELLLPPGQSIAKGQKPNPGLVNEWLIKLVDTINHQCSVNLEEEFTIETLEKLAIEISKLCQSEYGICIFIDDGDRFDDGGWSEFEQKILAPLAKQENLRFVIAIREERGVKPVALHFSDERIALAPLAPLLGEKQIECLRDSKPVTSLEAIELLSTLLQQRDYDLVHPGLNNFICLFAEDNPQDISNFNVANIFRSALESVYPHSRGEIINTLIALLYRLSRLTDKWPIEEIVDQFQVSSTQAWDYIQLLKEYSLIKQELNLYEIVGGFREFVRAILMEENYHPIMPGIAINLPNDFHYKMDKRFMVEELKEICFNLDIDPENALLGEKKLSKIITLIDYCSRHGREAELIVQCQQLRPGFDWLQ